MQPVIIVGAGPTGLALALALARQGVPTLVLDEGDGRIAPRPARTCVLPPDTARWAGLPAAREDTEVWEAWRTTHRGRTAQFTEFTTGEAPVHLPQHTLEQALRDAARGEELVRLAPGCRLTGLEQDADGVTADVTTGDDGAGSAQHRGSHLVGCDGSRSTVRKLLGIPFPGRTAVERYAVAALRLTLPWPGEAGLHRALRGPGRGEIGEVTARPLAGGRWRLDWPLPDDTSLVTPDAMLDRIHRTLAAWHEGDIPEYALLDTGVHICHQRLARRWRSGRAFLAGDAAHLVGALGAQQVAESLRDVQNLAWKLAVDWHHGDAEVLLDSYQAERRAAVGRRLRAVDQALPLVRGRNALTERIMVRGRARLTLLTDSQLGRGALGTPGNYANSPLAPPEDHGTVTDTPPGSPVADVPVTALDGSRARLHDWLGGPPLVVLTAPGSRVWDARHWLSAGLIPELAATLHELPMASELLVTEAFPGAPAHTLLVVRPDGHLAAALPGADLPGLRACVTALRGVAPRTPAPRPR
ncbi:FAD-dependent monooxygenase [Streptomyces sp. ACA25]|nr:FAD-dependent monooxygenase [Streptomyces sp. ACA25]MDB1088853.1 FAD-dependent monooxygenase [Streptomyces sp. ACA25]